MNPIKTEIRLGAAENSFAQIVWDNEPISTGELIQLCKKELDWARSTTYTVLNRLCGKGLFQICNGMVSAVLSREEFKKVQSEAFMADTFGGSLPAFIAAFTAGKKLNAQEAEEIRRMIDACVVEDAGETSMNNASTGKGETS